MRRRESEDMLDLGTSERVFADEAAVGAGKDGSQRCSKMRYTRPALAALNAVKTTQHRCLRSSKPALSVLGVCLISVPGWCGPSATDASIIGAPGHASIPGVQRPASAAASARDVRWVAAAAETLDLEDLERRLVDTKAIGFLSKLSLKGKMDGFVKDLRAVHVGASEHTLEKMRERYDPLVHNVQTMLERKDPALAGDIAAEREQMWKLLADVEQFEKTVGGMV